MWRNESRTVPSARISVIVPVLQEEKILAQSLGLFTQELRQRYAIELVVSDGGSTDATVDIAKRFADVVVVHSATRRQTIAEGRNRGAEVASGSVLVFLNGDSFPAMPVVFFDFIEEWSRSEGKYARHDVMACPVEVLPNERKWSDVLFHSFFNTVLKVLTLMNFGVGRGECQIVKPEIFREVGGYNAGLAAGEDFDFIARIARNHSVAIANELLVYESPRRYRRYGYVPILWSWFMNWVGASLFKRSYSREWTVVR
ncbi:MAG: glycosyltransferase [Candidatus Kapaibacterium sp.]